MIDKCIEKIKTYVKTETQEDIFLDNMDIIKIDDVLRAELEKI